MSGLKITDHAVARFRERIRSVQPELARDEIAHCLQAANPKHLMRLKKAKRVKRGSTTMVGTGCCVFVFEGLTMVTCLDKALLHKKSPELKKL